MSAEEFRARARDVVQLILDYQTRHCREAPVLSRVEPGDVLRALPEHPPEEAEGWSRVLEDVREIVLPGLTNWQSPNFFGYFPANSSEPAILGDLLCAGLAVQGMLWQTAPACTELETRVMDWLAEIIGLPERFTSRAGATGAEEGIGVSASPAHGSGGSGGGGGGGVIQGTASEAVVVAMVAARHRAITLAGVHLGPHDRARLDLVAYCSDQAHSSVVKAAMVTGVGANNVRTIVTDESLAMNPRALAAAMAEDRAAHRIPFFITATLGTTATGAFDPLASIGRIARESTEQPWLHVDAAWAGAALVCPEHRWFLDGVELADSFNFNPHKWLLTNFDCSALWTADRRALVEALSITPAYLRNKASDAGAVIDYRDWQVPLGRRFRALKLWFVIRHYGVRGLRAHIREHVRLTEVFEGLVREDERFEVPLARSLGLVVFRLRDDEDGSRTRALVERVNASGDLFLITTTVPIGPGRSDRVVARLAIGSPRTTEADVRRAWERITGEADRGV